MSSTDRAASDRAGTDRAWPSRVAVGGGALLALTSAFIAVAWSTPDQVWMTYYREGRGLVVADGVGGADASEAPWIVSRDRDGVLVGISAWKPYSVLDEVLALFGDRSTRQLWFVPTGRRHTDVHGQTWRHLVEGEYAEVFDRALEANVRHGPR